MANEVKVTIGAITFNDYTPGGSIPTSLYTLTKTPELLNTLSTRVTRTPKQAEHGVFDSMSWLEERMLPFEGVIFAPTQAERAALESDLKKELTLSPAQDYAGDDGYKTLLITMEDGTLVQTQAKLTDPPRFNVIDNVDPTMREFSFVMMARDPFLYSQTLNTQSGVESSDDTNFSVVKDNSPKIPFLIYLETSSSSVATNAGNVLAPSILVITGPTDSPQVTNETTGDFMKLDTLVLTAGETATIDVLAKSILKNDGTDLSGLLTSDSVWIFLALGANSFSILDDTPSAIEATLDVKWRDTYL